MSESDIQGLNHSSSMLILCPYQPETPTFGQYLVCFLDSDFIALYWIAPAVPEQSHQSRFQSKCVLVGFDLPVRTCRVMIS